MRRPFIAGNWKMNTDLKSAVDLAEAVAKRAETVKDVDLAICPPFVYLSHVAKAIAGSAVALGAQNGYYEPSGAFTGEVSMAMLKDIGCRYVILGHSERRHILRESSEEVNLKVHAALAAGLVPIVCLGELLAEREAGKTADVIRRQFDGSLSGVSAEAVKGIVLAYEPVWAIGTGKTATPAQAEEVHLGLRKLLEARYNREAADSVRIQYGGSVKPQNARDLLGQANIDGALVGGASLVADQFFGIVEGAGR